MHVCVRACVSVCVCGVMIIDVRRGLSHPCSNPERAVCFSYSANTLEKSLNPAILPPVMGK